MADWPCDAADLTCGVSKELYMPSTIGSPAMSSFLSMVCWSRDDDVDESVGMIMFICLFAFVC
jgi:hypothetical protein